MTDRDTEFSSVEESLGYRFRDAELLRQALTHASYAHENAGVESNERLEFLGDAVIGVVVAHRLFVSHPEWQEGDLTRGLHALVDKNALADLGRRLDIGPRLRLGRTEKRSAGESKETILADAVEAIIGAMYLDGGLAPVESLAQRSFADALASGAPRVMRDPKTRFQERVMARYGEFPSYRAVADSGVDGDPERFEMEVLVQGECWASGIGRSKRTAERLAAERALPRLDAEEAEGAEIDGESGEVSDDG